MPKFSVTTEIVLINYFGVQAKMVIEMKETYVDRFFEHALAEMYRDKRRLIPCPCRKCKLGSVLDPFSGKLQEHLLVNGFMKGYDTQWMTDPDDHEEQGQQQDNDDDEHEDGWAAGNEEQGHQQDNGDDEHKDDGTADRNVEQGHQHVEATDTHT